MDACAAQISYNNFTVLHHLYLSPCHKNDSGIHTGHAQERGRSDVSLLPPSPQQSKTT